MHWAWQTVIWLMADGRGQFMNSVFPGYQGAVKTGRIERMETALFRCRETAGGEAL